MSASDHYIRIQLTDINLIQRVRKLHEILQSRQPVPVLMADVARLLVKRGLEVVEKEILIK